MIPNDDNYILLKQLLVVHQTCLLGAEVNVDTSNITVEGTCRAIKRLLGQIEENFTIPYYMLEGKPVAFDMRTWCVALREVRDPLTEDSEAYSWITKSNTVEGINDCVNKYPQSSVHIKAFKESLTNGELWGQSRQVAADLVSEVCSCINAIQYWVESANAKPLVQILIMVNMIMQVEIMFQYINDYHSAEDNAKRQPA